MIRGLFTVLLVSVCNGIQAAPVTIDFDEFPTSSTPVEQPLATKGYVFTSANPIAVFLEPGSSDGSALIWNNSLTMEITSNGTFSLHQLYAAQQFSVDIVFTGYLQGGGTVERVFEGFQLTEQTVLFDSSWADLTRVDIMTESPSGVIFDDIVTSVVPIPAAVWLFGSALLGLGFARRSN